MNFPEHIIPATFLKKQNRFVGEVLLDGHVELVYIPNTGRLGELLVDQAQVLLVPYTGKFRYKLLYGMYKGYPVMIDSVATNRYVGRVLEEKKLPGYEGYQLLRREPGFEHHRFDFLLASPEGNWQFMEVKSCTLAWNTIASFPDAVSSRATDHVKVLAGTENPHLAFILYHSPVEYFVANFHTDYIFYRTLSDLRHTFTINSYAVEYDDDFKPAGFRPVSMLWPEIPDCGVILLYGPAGKEFMVCEVPVRENMLKAEKKKWKVTIGGGDFMSRKILPLRGINTCSAGCHETFSHRCIEQGITDEGFRYWLFKEDPMMQEWFWDVFLEERFGHLVVN